METSDKRGGDRRKNSADIYIDRRVKARRDTDKPYTAKMNPTLRKKRTAVFSIMLLIFLVLNVLDFILTIRGVSLGVITKGPIVFVIGAYSLSRAAVIKFAAATLGVLILFKFRFFWVSFFMIFLVNFFYAFMVANQLIYQFLMAPRV
ncbi:MAG: hypothetical protein QMD53_05950 [Actinomycetota bacterium]|nr:hypothetical protein [Actinomycetota bacterium]